jgi:SAM-dependent methyltransferase
MTSEINIFDRGLLRQRRTRMSEDCDFLFREVAERLFERLSIVRKEFPVVLELGPGFMAEGLKERPGTDIVICADLAAAPRTSVVCDVEALPFAPHSLDAVVSCLDLHWVNDLPGVLSQIRLALKPDGVFLAALVGGETLKELRSALMEGELQATGGASPRISPFVDLRDMGALMQRAGFALPVIDSDSIVIDYADMFRLMHDLRGMGAANATFNRLLKPTRRAVFMEAARIYQEKFCDANGHIPATFDIIYVIGWSPHADQQKPLRPGSAQIRLADVLKVQEIPAGEKAGG